MKLSVVTGIVIALCAGVCHAQNTLNFPTIGHVDRFDDGVDSLIASEAKIEVLCGGFEWAEGPVWVPDAAHKFGEFNLYVGDDGKIWA